MTRLVRPILVSPLLNTSLHSKMAASNSPHSHEVRSSTSPSIRDCRYSRSSLGSMHASTWMLGWGNFPLRPSVSCLHIQQLFFTTVRVPSQATGGLPEVPLRLSVMSSQIRVWCQVKVQVWSLDIPERPLDLAWGCTLSGARVGRVHEVSAGLPF